MFTRLAFIAVCMISLLEPYRNPLQSNSTTPLALMLSATIESIGVVAPYTGDDNQNNFALLYYREAGSYDWLEGHELYIDRSARQWRGSMVALTPATSYEIEVRFTDPDGTQPYSMPGSIYTRPDYPDVGNSQTFRYVPDEGDLKTVIDAASPGDTIRIRAGTYYTSIVLSDINSGTPGHYITIEADPGSHVVFDGSDPAINDPDTDNWIRYENSNIYYTDISWGDKVCKDSGSLPNYVGELRNGEGYRFLLYNQGSDDWDKFISAPPGKAYYSCDGIHTLGRLYITTYESDDPDSHEIHASRYLNGLVLAGTDYLRIRNLGFRYYSQYAMHLNEPSGKSVEAGADNNIIEGNTFHGNRYGLFIGHSGDSASANNLIQDNVFFERGYKESGWTWDTQYHFANSVGLAIIWAQSGNVVRRNQFTNQTDSIEVQYQSHDTDVYDNAIQFCMDDGIEVDQEPSYNIRVWGNVIQNCLSGISTQDWFMGSYWNTGPVYIFRNIIAGGRDPFNRSDSDGKIYSSEYAFKVGADIPSNGLGRVYIYHNTISIPDSTQNGNGIQNAGGYYFSGIVSRNNIWKVTRQVFQLSDPETIIDHSLDCDNLHNPGTRQDDKFIRWSNTGGPFGDGVYPDLPSYQSGTGQELNGISYNYTRFNPDYTLRAGSLEINRGCILKGFNDRGIWAYLGSKPDIGAFEYDGPSILMVYIPVTVNNQ